METTLSNKPTAVRNVGTITSETVGFGKSNGKPNGQSKTAVAEHYTNPTGTKDGLLEGLLNQKLPLNEERYLPFEMLSKEDLQAVFAPHYTESVSKVLTEEIQRGLELTVFHRLKWILEGDLESFRWHNTKLSELMGRPFNPDNITQKHAQDAYERYPYSPYFRLGFADTPFKVEVTNADFPNSSENPLIKAMSDKAGKDKILVTVFVAAKITPVRGQVEPFITIETVFAYDRDSSIFNMLRMNYETTEFPATDIPLFFQGIDHK